MQLDGNFKSASAFPLLYCFHWPHGGRDMDTSAAKHIYRCIEGIKPDYLSDSEVRIGPSDRQTIAPISRYQGPKRSCRCGHFQSMTPNMELSPAGNKMNGFWHERAKVIQWCPIFNNLLLMSIITVNGRIFIYQQNWTILSMLKDPNLISICFLYCHLSQCLLTKEKNREDISKVTFMVLRKTDF